MTAGLNQSQSTLSEMDGTSTSSDMDLKRTMDKLQQPEDELSKLLRSKPVESVYSSLSSQDRLPHPAT